MVDEATANVDLDTDRLVQEVLKSSLQHRTVITIAHRIDTVMAADRIVVMADGEVVEMGDPNVLIASTDSHFSKLIKDHAH